MVVGCHGCVLTMAQAVSWGLILGIMMIVAVAGASGNGTAPPSVLGVIQGEANALSLPSHFGCWRLRRAILGNGWLPRQNSAGNLGLSESRVPISS